MILEQLEAFVPVPVGLKLSRSCKIPYSPPKVTVLSPSILQLPPFTEYSRVSRKIAQEIQRTDCQSNKYFVS